MIGTRGPNNTPVLERNAVPLKDICEAVVLKDNVSTILQRFNISFEELSYCANAFIENYGPTESDFIEIECDRVQGDLDVVTAGVSDWVFITVVMMGYESNSEEDKINNLFAHGLRIIMYDCLKEVANGETVDNLGFMHKLVYDSFLSAYGNVSSADAQDLLETLEVKEF